MIKIRQACLWIIALHTISAFIHNQAHNKIEVSLSTSQNAFATIVIVFVNRHVSRLAPGGKMERWGWFMGLASFCFWPAAIVLGIVFLRDPKQVRIGRACVIGGLLNVTMAVVISCVITAILFLKFPEYIPR